MAILEAETDGCDTRPHPKKNLADKGHKEFLWTYAYKQTSEARKTRVVEASKSQEVTGDEVEGIMDCIDTEEPVPAVGGRMKRKLGSDEAASAKKKAMEDKQKERDDKLAKMNPDEKKAFLEKEKVDGYTKKAKSMESKMAQALGKANKLEGKLMSTKRSAFINPEQMLKKLKAHKATLKLKQEKLQTTVGSALTVAPKILESKKFLDPIAEAFIIISNYNNFDIKN